MTHSTVSRERESGGSTEVLFHTIDITSLDNAGTEQYDPDTQGGVAVDHTGGIDVVGQEDATMRVVWDHLAEELNVVNVSDATDVANNTDVGEIRLRVEGV